MQRESLLEAAQPKPSVARRLWLLFAQTATVLLAAAFVAALLGFMRLPGIAVPGEIAALDAPATLKLAMSRVVPSVVSVRAAIIENDDLEDLALNTGFSLGSGVIVSDDGYIITNAHVIRGEPTILIETAAGELLMADIVGVDPDLDIAVLKVEASKPLQAARFAAGGPVAVGDLVVSVGSPFGLPGTATMGIVSATGRSGLGIAQYEHFIQTDAAINHGSSGGALANSAGEIVGISTALFARQTEGSFSQGIGFAIPAGLAQVAYEQIVEHGRFRRGWIGLEYKSIVSTREGSSGEDQLLVTGVEYGSPSGDAGLQEGDYILSFNGRSPTLVNPRDEALGVLMQPGDQISLGVERQGRRFDVDLIAREQNDAGS